MVPAERFELPTFGLQNRCTTTVLCRPLWDGGFYIQVGGEDQLSLWGVRDFV
jgi:hypothetical protein